MLNYFFFKFNSKICFKKLLLFFKNRFIMKKILSFIIVIITLVSCGEEISVKDSAVFQGVKDNSLWEGGNATATIEVGNKLTIKAETFNEIISLKIPKPTLIVDPRVPNGFITHVLGTSLTKKAVYLLTSGNQLYTYETAIGVGDGEIVIKEYDGNVISGTFRFNALNTDPNSEGQPTVNLQNGYFYKVPVR